MKSVAVFAFSFSSLFLLVRAPAASFILSSICIMASSKPKALWKADDQQARLAELTARSDEAAKDNPLRRDVRSLGAILGQVLVEQSGQEIFESVEELRRLLIGHRETAHRESGRRGRAARRGC